MRLVKALKYFYLLFWPSLGAMYYAVCIDFLDLMQGQKLREHKIMFCLRRFVQCVVHMHKSHRVPKGLRQSHSSNTILCAWQWHTAKDIN